MATDLPPSPLTTYLARFSAVEQQLDALQQRYRLISNARLLVFVLGAGLTYGLFTLNFWAGMLAGVGALLGFMYLLKVHSVAADQRDHQRRLRRILREEIEAQRGHFEAFDPGEAFIDPQHTFSYDLDLFGPRSIYQYINRTGTEAGRSKLAHWFQQPELSVAALQARQAAVQELTQRQDWGIEFQALTRAHRATEVEAEALQTWAQASDPLSRQSYWDLLTRLLPALLLLSILAWLLPDFEALRGFFGGWHLPGWVPLGLFLAQLGLAGYHLKPSNHQHQQVSRKARLLDTYAQLLTTLEGEDWQSPLMQQLRERLRPEGQRAGEAIAELRELVYRFDQRLNMVAGLLLNGTVSWDLRYRLRFERWRVAYQGHIAQWLAVITEVDALLSLARLAHNRPDLSWPKIEHGTFRYEADGLGHPLLDPETRVDNSVAWSGPGEFLVVTGANMAGKSTFLRSVGVSLVMAMAGAPVCARQLYLVPIPLISSVRATDSLADHESYFYAELKQLKAIIDQLAAHGPAFVIVDEMLRGTNSRDKQVGSRRFIEQLIRLQGVGLVATHDLSLGTLADEYPGQVRNKRFEVDITDEQLTFDYRLRDGISQNLNATFLMQQMGIMPKNQPS